MARAVAIRVGGWLGVSTAALFVFFSRAAGARFVSADFWLFEADLLYGLLGLRGLGGGALSFGHGELADLVVAGLAYLIDASGAGASLEANFEDDVADSVLDGVEHLVEGAEALAFVLDAGVSFGKGAGPDALLEAVHSVEVVLPGAVVDLQEDVFFEVGELGAQEFAGGFVDFLSGVVLLGEVVFGKAGAKSLIGPVDEFGFAEA